MSQTLSVRSRDETWTLQTLGTNCNFTSTIHPSNCFVRPQSLLYVRLLIFGPVVWPTSVGHQRDHLLIPTLSDHRRPYLSLLKFSTNFLVTFPEPPSELNSRLPFPPWFLRRIQAVSQTFIFTCSKDQSKWNPRTGVKNKIIKYVILTLVNSKVIWNSERCFQVVLDACRGTAVGLTCQGKRNRYCIIRLSYKESGIYRKDTNRRYRSHRVNQERVLLKVHFVFRSSLQELDPKHTWLPVPLHHFQ